MKTENFRLPRRLAFVLVLVSALLLPMSAFSTPPVLSYIAERDHGKGLNIHGNVQVTPEGYLHFNGEEGFATFPNSGEYNITTKGYAVLMTCRLPADLGDEALLAVVNKIHCFRANRLRKNGFYVTLTPSDKDGKLDESSEVTLRGGRTLPRGEWMHLAITAEYINDRAQGNVGYSFRYFVNGELMAEKMAPWFEPFQSGSNVAIGLDNNGLGPYIGDVAAVEVYDRFVSEAEITNKITADSRLKLYIPVGFRAANNNVVQQVAKLRATVLADYQSWLVDAFERADVMEGDVNAIVTALEAVAQCSRLNQSPEQFTDEFNRAQPAFRLIATPQALLLIANQPGSTNPPVIDLYHRAAKCGTFAGRCFAWQLKVGGSEYFDHTPGISYQMKNFTEHPDGADFTVVWTLDQLTVNAQFQLRGARLTAKLSGSSATLPITDYLFPKLVLNKLPGQKDTAVLPHFCGTLFPLISRGGSHRGLYPNAEMTLACLGYYDELENGVYMAWEDPSCCIKEFLISGKQQKVELDFSSFVGISDFKQGNAFTMPGEFVLEFYRGDWFDVGQIYKKFLKTTNWYPEHPRLDSPEWYRNSVLNISNSRDNQHYPYLREYFGLPFVVVCSSPPPHFDKLRQQDVRIKCYTNIRLWKYYSPISSNSPKDQFDKYMGYQMSPESQNSAIRLADGSVCREFYSKFPWNVGCPSSTIWQNQLRQTVLEYANKGVWSAIYHDQLNSSPKRCYNPDHGHLLSDPHCWIKGYRDFLSWFADQRKQYPELAQDGEDFSEAYARWTDGYMVWRFVQPNQVPLVQSLYSGGRVQFTGRSFNDSFASSDEGWLCKIATQLVYGEQLGWFSVNDIFPDTYRRIFVKKLMHLRYELLSYFNDSDMLPFLKFKQDVPVMRSLWGGLAGGAKYVETPQVLHTVWQRSDGNVMIIFLNTANSEISLAPNLPTAGKLAICREGKAEVDIPAVQAPTHLQLNLAPYASEVWFIGNDNETPAKLARKMAEFPTYTTGKKLIGRNSK